MRIEFDNVVARAIDLSPPEESWLWSFLSFANARSRFDGKGRFRVFDLQTHTFPTGLIGTVVREHQRLGKLAQIPAGAKEDLVDEKKFRPRWRDSSKIEVVDKREKPCDPNLDLDRLAWLYWFQRDAVKAVCRIHRGVVKAPTGSGKTEIAVGIVLSIPCRWLLLAHRAQLMNNAAERFIKRERERIEREFAALEHHETGAPDPPEVFARMRDDLEWELEELHVGRFGDSIDDVAPDDRFICATFQTVADSLKGRGGELVRSAQGVIIDECHVQAATSFFGVTQAAVNAFYRIGLSGTPFNRGDQKNMLTRGALGKLVYRIKAATLIDEGILARPIIRMVEHDTSPDLPSRDECKMCEGKGEVLADFENVMVACGRCGGSGLARQKWATVYRHAVVKSKRRNKMLVDVAKKAAKPCMLFVDKTDHGKALKQLIEKAGLNVRFVWGAKSTKQREQALADLARGHLDVLIATKIMQEGVDLPSLASMINGGAGKSGIKILQEMGRALRATKTKKTCEIWDVFDVGSESFRRQSNARKKHMREEVEQPIEIVGDQLSLNVA